LSPGLIKEKNKVQRKTKEIFKRLIAIFLLVLLTDSYAIKIADNAFHDHHDFACNIQDESCFHQHHEKCLIHSFEFSLFVLKTPILSFIAIPYFPCFSIYYQAPNIYKPLNHSFLFRAPPVHMDLSLKV
jgi:hypothetical protein